MAEGDETPGGRYEGPGRRSEGDLLAERRARRASESGDAVLTRRAEAAEATVETLERHVASLQLRVRDAEEERRRLADLLESEREGALGREMELRRVKQREYAEQQLRVEAEERLDSISAGEIDALGERLGASERLVRELSQRLERTGRALAEAEQAAAARRAASEQEHEELHARVAELERRAAASDAALHLERAARERTEALLEGLRDGSMQVAAIVGEVRGLLERLIASAGTVGPAWGPAAQAQSPPGREELSQMAAEVAAPADGESGVQEERGAEMADALAAAVERLRARAQAADAPSVQAAAPPAARPVHKHTMSFIARWRLRRKQRRGQ